jgi:type I restriction enzyme S subunit
MGNEWKTSSLKELGVQLIDCDHKTPKAVENGIPYIGIPQMDEGRINFDANPRLISEEDYVKWTKKANPQYGDIILSRRCNSGETVYVPKDVKFALGQNLVLLRPAGDKLHPEYLRWAVQGKEWWNEVAKYLNPGAIFESLKCGEIPKFKIKVPPKEEQKKIADMLTNINDKIELNRETNQTLEAMAQALFKSWFVDFDPVFDNAIAHNLANNKDPLHNIPEPLLPHAQRRLNVHNVGRGSARQSAAHAFHHLFPQTFEQSDEPSVGIQGWVPQGWGVSELKGLISIKHGYAFKGEFFTSEITKDVLLTPGNVAIGGGFKGDKFKYYDGPVYDDYIFNKNDMYINMTDLSKAGDTLGYPAFVPKVDGIAFHHNQRLGRVFHNDSEKYGSEFIYRCLCTEEYRNYIVASATGTTVKHTSPTKILAHKVITSCGVIEPVFESMISEFTKKKDLINTNTVTLTKLRDTLLPKLISGELRLPDAEQQVEALAK